MLDMYLQNIPTAATLQKVQKRLALENADIDTDQQLKWKRQNI